MSTSSQTAVLVPQNLHEANRRGSIELLRFAACIGIIWFHCHAPGAIIGYAGVPAFIALSAGLASAQGKTDPFHVIVAKRAKRLLIPWAFWCLVYGIKEAAKSYLQSKSIYDHASWWMLLVGTSFHLWYLPFVFVITCLVSLLKSVCWPSGGLAKTLTSLIGVAIFFPICSYILPTYPWPVPVTNWIFSVPAVFIGLALPQMALTRESVIISSVLMLTVAILSLGDRWIGLNSLSVPYFVGTACLITAWIVPLPFNKYIEWMGQISFGVYLTHQLFHTVVRQTTLPHESAAFAVAVILVSIGMVTILRQSAFFRSVT